MTGQVAHMNWGILRADWDAPEVAGFVAGLDAVNALAMRTPGYVWHMPEDEMDAAQNDPDGIFSGNPRVASTLSVWDSAEALRHFTMNTLHGAFLARRAEWYLPAEQGDAPRYVIWPHQGPENPTMAEARVRLDHLHGHGSSDYAYDFKWLKRIW